MLPRTLVALGLLAPVVAAAPALAQSYTTRIEPRPYYGAVVTLEQGVRVWRPLPPTRHMIINPTNAPVNLSVADINERVESRNYVYGGADGGSSAAAAAAAGGGYYGPRALPRGLRGHHRPGGHGHRGARGLSGGLR